MQDLTQQDLLRSFTHNQNKAFSNVLSAAVDNELTNRSDYQIGYNDRSGYVWMWFEDINVTVVAPDYNPSNVMFYVMNYEDGNEYEYETLEEAEAANKAINA